MANLLNLPFTRNQSSHSVESSAQVWQYGQGYARIAASRPIGADDVTAELSVVLTRAGAADLRTFLAANSVFLAFDQLTGSVRQWQYLSVSFTQEDRLVTCAISVKSIRGNY
jgi:hypothetical protein